MPARLTLLLLLLLLLPSVGVGQETGLERRERTEWLPEDRVAIDRGPLDHLGWGTLEDLHVDLGAGAAVNVLSGNLVLDAPLFVRADSSPDARLALTYNHLDASGSTELAPGWSWDLGRSWTHGAWGDRVLVDADGFRDSLFAGEPPTADQVRSTVEDVVRAWRRATPRRDRRAAGGDDAMRAMLAADPLFFAEMRLRLLGPAEVEVVGQELTFTSSNRGHRTMEDQDDGEVVLTRADGGWEVYTVEGLLKRIEPAIGPAVELVRESGRISTVKVAGNERWFVSHDSWGRIGAVRSTRGTSVSLDYAGRHLWRMETAVGAWKLGYDTGGRLTSLDSPQGLLQVEYDETTGRVRRASGPRGEVTLSDLVEGPDEAVTAVAGFGGRQVTCSWSSKQRLRRTEAGDRSQEVRFEAHRPLPEQVVTQEGTFGFVWNEQGRLVAAARDGIETRWSRDDQGRLEALIEPGGGRADVVRGDSGDLLGWTDPAGRRTGMQLDASGLPRNIERPGGLTETAWRTSAGLLRSVSASGGESLELRRDSRGFLRTVESVLSGSAGFSVDAAGQLERFEAPGGLVLSLDRDSGGALRGFDDGRGTATFGYAADGLLEGWQAGGATTSITRDTDRLPQQAGDGWRVSRDPQGRVTDLSRPGWPDLSLDHDAQGQPTAWTDGARAVELDRDRHGRVVGLEGFASVDLERDRAGRVTGVQRGSASWSLGRDGSGRVTSVTDPVGGITSIQLDPAGRPTTISAPQSLRWRLSHDAAGHLAELRGAVAAWTLRHDRAGRPVEFTGPDRRTVELTWDRAGRWRSLSWLRVPGHEASGQLEVSHSPWGPTSVGGLRRMIGPNGAFDAWGPVDEAGAWQVDRDSAGRATGVRWRQSPGAARGTRREARERALTRDPAGRVLAAGPWQVRWTGDRLEELRLPDGSPWRQARDPRGRVRRLDGPDGRSAEVERDAAGDARTLVLRAGEQSWSFSVDRDSAGRITTVSGPPDLRWDLLRDPAGRVIRWQVNGAWSLDIEPLDGTAGSGDGVLADALAVEVDDGPAPAGRPSGSRRLELRAAGALLLELEEIRGLAGDLVEVASPWGTTGGARAPYPGALLEESPLEPRTEPPSRGAVLDQSPLEGPSSPAPSPVGGAEVKDGGEVDPIAAALEARSTALAWAAATLFDPRGDPFVPSPDGRGSGIGADSGWLRLAGEGGETISWISPVGRVEALRLPRPGGTWTSPEGWLAYPAPPGALDPVQAGAPMPPPHPGDAAGVERWWSDLSPTADRYARLPRHTAAGPAWIAPRLALQSADALLPAVAPAAGPGALVPPVPVADRLLPGPPGVIAVAPLTALVLSGDLPPDADAHRAWLSAPAPAWMVEVPGAHILRDVAERRHRPSVAPGWSREPVAGLAPGLDGLLSVAGDARERDRAWELRPAIGGLPAGTADLAPGLCASLPGAAATLPSQARCTAWDSLSDDPLVPGARRRELADDDALLLFAAAWRAELPGPLSGWLAPIGITEAWAVELPSGVRLVLGARGELLSADLMGRLRRAFGARAAAGAGRALLHPGLDPAVDLPGPRWLPEASDLPESRWGLAPADPRLPLAATGEPELALLRALAGLPPADPAGRWPPRLP